MIESLTALIISINIAVAAIILIYSTIGAQASSLLRLRGTKVIGAGLVLLAAGDYITMTAGSANILGPVSAWFGQPGNIDHWTSIAYLLAGIGGWLFIRDSWEVLDKIDNL